MTGSAKQSILSLRRNGLLRCARNDGGLFSCRLSPAPSLRGAQRRSNPHFSFRRGNALLRCARNDGRGFVSCRLSPSFRRCEERSDDAIHSFFARRDGLLRFARNDGAARWIACAQRVGWVERSDTHQLHFMKMMGFAGLNPSYELGAELVRRRSTSDAEPTRQSSNRHSFRRPFNPSVDARVQMIAFGCRIVH